MNKDQAIKGYDLVCAMRNHEYVKGKLSQDRAMLADAPDSSEAFYKINNAQYPKEAALTVLDGLIKYHESEVVRLTEELAAI